MCIACRRRESQSSLQRLVVTEDGGTRIVVDSSRSLPGRGAWIHPAEECWSAAYKKNAFARAFRGAPAEPPDSPCRIHHSEKSG
ncbi:YlxR family protein [Brevibacterium daeguense]|uniref:YlxR family protein n=1 Tax=Brevibacterium daeguense TaxID=909936 RepID=UPI0034DEE365